MKELMNNIGVDKSVQVDRFIINTLNNIEKTKETYEKFCLSLFTSNPTPAHYALKRIAIFLETSIITENIDILHERSGILPYHTEGAILTNDIDPTQFIAIDAFICIGLRYDDRGLLTWYKEYNPTGKIIAIDLQCPNYLGEEDYLVVGDVQHILPEMDKRLVTYINKYL